jgi:hypothetical protein
MKTVGDSYKVTLGIYKDTQFK